MSQKFSYIVIIALAVLCFVLSRDKFACPTVARGAVAQTQVPSIEVNASESKRFLANEFVVHASLQLAGAEKESLFKQVAERRNKIFEIAKELEIADGDVQQNSVELRKQWSYNDGTRKFVQYEGSQDFTIKVGDRRTAANLVEALSMESDVEVGRTSASLKNAEALQKSIVDAAGKKALEKAAMYAGSVGVKLGKIMFIGTGYNDGVVDGGVMLLNAAPMAKGRMNGGDMGSIADSVTLSAEVRLMVEIEE